MRIECIKGDITEIEVDVIVNAANTSLLGGGGVDGAIHRKGGPEILEDCIKIRNRQGGCQTGEAVITTAGKLPAQYVIHTVGPVWDRGLNREEEMLENCYQNSLVLAEVHQAKSIAFPNISTGVYRFPKAAAAEIAIRTVNQYAANGTSIERLVFVCFDTDNFRLYQQKLATANGGNERPGSGRKRNYIQIGQQVAIVQKHHQSSGELTEGIVKRILTKSANHPRGIKVMLESGEIGRVKKILE